MIGPGSHIFFPSLFCGGQTEDAALRPVRVRAGLVHYGQSVQVRTADGVTIYTSATTGQTPAVVGFDAIPDNGIPQGVSRTRAGLVHYGQSVQVRTADGVTIYATQPV